MIKFYIYIVQDVHEALRIAEESLQVAQAELKDALSKCKTAQQEVMQHVTN